jgi:hypothetical protein
MMNGRFGHVAEPPVAGESVGGQEFLLASDEEPGHEPADFEESGSPDDRRSCHEARERRTGHSGFAGQGALCEHAACRVFPILKDGFPTGTGTESFEMPVPVGKHDRLRITRLRLRRLFPR